MLLCSSHRYQYLTIGAIQLSADDKVYRLEYLRSLLVEDVHQEQMTFWSRKVLWNNNNLSGGKQYKNVLFIC